MDALCGKGHSGSSAIGYLLKRLPAEHAGFTTQAYGALTCMGRSARPALPYLIQASADDGWAVETLGHLARYYPDTIVPHLIQLLDNPARADEAAFALEHAGAVARPALGALISHLASAVAESHPTHATQLIAAVGSLGDPGTTVPVLLPLLDEPGTRDAITEALGKIGPPAAAAVPRLIDRLDDPELSQRERYLDIEGLASIDSHAPQVQGVLLREAVSDKDVIGNINAALALGKIDPLPPDFAPQLIVALESLPAQDNIRTELELALQHTHTGKHTVGSRERSPPVNIDNTLIDELWALVQQPQPLTLNDVIKHLGLKREDYDLEGNATSGYLLDARWVVYHNRPDSVPIAHVTFFGGAMGHLPAAPTIQEVRIGFSKRFCLASGSVAERVSRPSESDSDGQPLFTLRGAALDQSLARQSWLALGAECSGHIGIGKSFDPSLVIDPAFIDGTAK
jgi:HEAT repeat protein